MTAANAATDRHYVHQPCCPSPLLLEQGDADTHSSRDNLYSVTLSLAGLTRCEVQTTETAGRVSNPYSWPRKTKNRHRPASLCNFLQG